MKGKISVVLLISIFLSACASSQNKVAAQYGNYGNWLRTLHDTVQVQLHYPEKFLENTPTSGYVTVQFTYDKGKLRNAVIVGSTGSNSVDSSLVEQIDHMTIAPPDSAKSLPPHRFQLQLKIPQPETGHLQNSFFHELFEAIQKKALITYPRDAILHGQSGVVSVGFTYLNGTISNVSVISSSGTRSLDNAAIEVVKKANYAKTPDTFKSQPLHLEVTISFTLFGAGSTATNLQPVSTRICSEVGFDDLGGKIKNAHLLDSSGNATFDKEAVASVAKGTFKPPKDKSGKHQTVFKIAVCYQGK